MAVFLEVVNDLVTASLVLSEEAVNDLEFPESEPVGQAFIASLGIAGIWLQTSPEGLYRGCYGGIGYTYNETLGEYGEFVPPVVE